MGSSAVDVARELYTALRSRAPVAPLKGRVPGLDIDMAYAISAELLVLRLGDGERVVGYKVGVTSRVVQDLLGVHDPDFGVLTDAMRCDSVVPAATHLIQPRLEGEIALRLAHDLVGPGITAGDVLDATASVHPCFEIVDSRVEAWRIAIEDTIADNASAGMFVVGDGVSPRGVDLEGCRMDVWKNGQPLSTGYGRGALGSPLLSVAWLANALGARFAGLRAGDWVLTGSLVPLEPVTAGDRVALTVEGIGGVEVVFR